MIKNTIAFLNEKVDEIKKTVGICMVRDCEEKAINGEILCVEHWMEANPRVGR